MSASEFSRYRDWLPQPPQLTGGRPNIQIQLVESCWQLNSLDLLLFPFSQCPDRSLTYGLKSESVRGSSPFFSNLFFFPLFWVFLIYSAFWNLDRHRMQVSLQRMTCGVPYSTLFSAEATSHNVALKHLKWGWCGQGTRFLILFNFYHFKCKFKDRCSIQLLGNF